MIGGSAGDYAICATVERPIRTANEFGENEVSWEPVFPDVWIAVESLSSREVLLARQAQLQITHKVRCRYFDGLTSDMRFAWDVADGTKRVLNINGIRNTNERNIEYVMECTETKAG